jgi:flagellar FliJ protein
MKRSRRLQLVLDLVRREEDAEATRMGVLRNQMKAAEAKLQELQDYQRTYHDELRHHVQRASTAKGLQVYHEFIAKLGVAIEHQQRQVEFVRVRLEKQQAVWVKINAKRKNMESFIDRCEKEEEGLAEKKLQRLLDDAQAWRRDVAD